jgi:chromosomal replication initiator protein
MNILTKPPVVVTPEYVEIWNRCLQIIRPAVGEQSFKTWFDPIRPVRLQQHTLTIQVPSQFFYEWLEENYVNVLKRAIVSELGNAAKLEYSIVIDRGDEHNQPVTINIPQQKPVAYPNGKQNGNPKVNEAKTTSLNPFELKPMASDLFESNLNAQYTFGNLIKGDCNQLAYNAGLSVACNPGATSFNPLVMYGGVGLGKTHLAQAIGNEVKKNHPRKFVLYVPCDLFITQFVEALRQGQVQEFTNYYNQADILIVDDVQFLAGKEKTQEHFFHIFNYLHQASKQIIMTSDCPPRELKGMQERLLSRFKWGLTADVQMPDYHTRMEIIRHKMASQGLEVPEAVVDFLAQNITTSVRDLQGVLISLTARAALTHRELNLALAKEALAHIVKPTEEGEVNLGIADVAKVVAEHFHLKPESLNEATRKQEIASARQIAMYFCHRYTKHSLKLVGAHFGGKDHSAVSHASKAVEKKMQSDPTYRGLVEALKAKLNIKHK